jgi:predicted aspartyl protease
MGARACYPLTRGSHRRPGETVRAVPPALARKVGAPTLPQRFAVSLADGRRRRLKACSIGVTVAVRTGPTTVLLLPGSDPLLGVETLEALGLKVNPERRRLEPSRGQTALLVGVRRPPRPRAVPIDDATRAAAAGGAPAHAPSAVHRPRRAKQTPTPCGRPFSSTACASVARAGPTLATTKPSSARRYRRS